LVQLSQILFLTPEKLKELFFVTLEVVIRMHGMIGIWIEGAGWAKYIHYIQHAPVKIRKSKLGNGIPSARQ